MSETAIFAFLLVFVRASATLMVAPPFGAQNTPLPIRILTTLSISAALTVAIGPKLGPSPDTMHGLAMAVLVEAGAGLLLGGMVNLAMQALTIAGSLADLQTGLTMSQVMNPIAGVSTSVLSQLKTMLGLVVFLASDSHHLLLAAFVRSYDAVPTLAQAHAALVPLLAGTFLLGVQIAAPVMGVGFLVDASLGLIARAVPTLQPTQVGAPAKLVAGLVAVSVGLPIVVAAVATAVHMGIDAAGVAFRHA